MLDTASVFYDWLNSVFKIDYDILTSKDKIIKKQIYRDNYGKFVYLFKNILKITVDKFNYHIYYNQIENAIFTNDKIRLTKLINNLCDFIVELKPITINSKIENKEIKVLKAQIYKRDSQSSLLICNSQEIGEFKVILNKYLKEEIIYLAKGSLINLINFDLQIKQETLLIAKSNSLIILEPDVKIDVTDIANCFQFEEANYKDHFVNLFEPLQISEHLFLGNVVNSIFDYLLEDSKNDFKSILESTFKNRILSGIYVVKNKLWTKIKGKAQQHFENLKLALSDLKFDNVLIEPSFSSDKYGIQGRLDALLLLKEDNNSVFEIIELKSSKAPKIDYIPAPNKNESKGIWFNNLTQVLCYNMLIEGVIKLNKGYLQLLYSSDSNNPFRYIVDSFELKREIIHLRNSIIATEKSIMNGNYNVFNGINPNDFGRRPFYYDTKVKYFNDIYSNLNELEKDYFHNYVSFLFRESFVEKTGTLKDESRLNNQQVESIEYLEIDFSRTNLDKMHIVFKFEEDLITSLRIGDQVLILPQNNNSGLLHKGYIRDFDEDYITIAIRNKLTIEEFFKRKTKWKLVQDSSDNLIKKLFPLLLNFFNAKNKNLILGIEKPNKKKLIKFNKNDLTKLQNTVVEEAISAKDYFLIQGPPGTGKTSKILLNIIKYYKGNSKNKILVTAYTNRAVDQIASNLLAEGINDFIRVGTKNNISENLLANYSESLEFRALIDKLDNCKIILTTISSAISNPELFELYKFDIGIIDEASQIIEVQLVGLLTYFDKFIMIGDEKQLPSVCAQDYDFRKVNSKNLNSIQLFDLGESLFSRLLKVCKVNSFPNYILLEEQGRMNFEIMQLANKMFYNNELKLLFTDIKSKIILNNPIIFLDNNQGKHIKIDNLEAKSVVSLIEHLINKGIEPKDIGVISPFRLQCHNIKNHLRNELKKTIHIDTVERFQGSEKEVIIISFATNQEYLIKQISSIYQFEDEIVDRKLNVAITRAKQQLILLGNSKILSNSNIFHELINYIKVYHHFQNMEDYLDEI